MKRENNILQQSMEQMISSMDDLVKSDKKTSAEASKLKKFVQMQ